MPPLQCDREILRYFDRIFQLGAGRVLTAQLPSATCSPTEREALSLERAYCTEITVFRRQATHVSAASHCVHNVPAVDHVLRIVLIQTNYISETADSSSVPSALLSYTSVARPSCEAVVGDVLHVSHTQPPSLPSKKDASQRVGFTERNSLIVTMNAANAG